MRPPSVRLFDDVWNSRCVGFGLRWNDGHVRRILDHQLNGNGCRRGGIQRKRGVFRQHEPKDRAMENGRNRQRRRPLPAGHQDRANGTRSLDVSRHYGEAEHRFRGQTEDRTDPADDQQTDKGRGVDLEDLRDDGGREIFHAAHQRCRHDE